MEALEDRSMLSGATDIVFLFDESESTGSVQKDWLASAVGNVDTSLSAAGITNRRYGLVGFGDTENSFGHTHLVDPTDSNQDGEKFFGSAVQLASATSKLKADGLREDGWDAVEHTVAEYNFRPGAAVVFVPIQNTDGRWSDNLVSWTREGILETLKSQNVTLCSIVEASFDPDMYGTGGFVYGVEAALGQPGSAQVAYVQNAVANGSPTIPPGIFRDGLHDINGSTHEGNTDDDYVRLAWETGGAAWNVRVLFDNFGTNQTIINQFNGYFTASLTNAVSTKLASGLVAKADSAIIEVNLGGPAMGSFIADNNPVLGTSFFSGTEAALIPNPLPTILPNGNSVATGVPLNVFQTGRQSTADHPNININVSPSIVPDGNYVVELMFASLDYNPRFFDVLLEEELVLSQYNVRFDYAAISTSPNANDELFIDQLLQNKPIVKRFSVDVVNGLQIELRGYFDGPGSAGALLNGLRVLKGDAPRVENVVLKSTSWAAGVNYNYAEAVAEGNQHRPVYLQNANRIEVHFDGPVDVSMALLEILGDSRVILKSTANASIAFENYNPTSFVATWILASNAVLGAGKYSLRLSGVKGSSGMGLDGMWANYDGPTLTAHTPDDFIDDKKVRLLSGNGGAGTIFEFHFSVLPGDYNQDGKVEAAVDGTAGVVKDGNGDGSLTTQDTSLATATYNNTQLFLRKSFGDYSDDEVVNKADYDLWKANFGSTSNLAADGNANGVVDQADYILWRNWILNFSAWYPQTLGSGMGIPVVDFGNAPTVTNVRISGSNSTHSPYTFDAHDGSGEQLRTIPIGDADTISITFSEDVNVTGDSLRFVGLRTFNTPTLAAFSYDESAMTATWRFATIVPNDQYVIFLADSVTDIEGNRLDGEWTNPTSLSTTNALVSKFPSGDGHAGGNFTFIVTLLTGDANVDCQVTYVDYSIWTSHFNQYGGFTIGDFDGNGHVETADILLFYTTYGRDLRNVSMLGDVNGDYIVDLTDLHTISSHFNMANPTHADGDINGDGKIDATDVDLVFAQFGIGLSLVS